MFDEADLNGDGIIDKSEFMYCVMQKANLKAYQAKDIFPFLDTSDDEFIWYVRLL